MMHVRARSLNEWKEFWLKHVLSGESEQAVTERVKDILDGSGWQMGGAADGAIGTMYAGGGGAMYGEGGGMCCDGRSRAECRLSCCVRRSSIASAANSCRSSVRSWLASKRRISTDDMCSISSKPIARSAAPSSGTPVATKQIVASASPARWLHARTRGCALRTPYRSALGDTLLQQHARSTCTRAPCTSSQTVRK